MPILNRIPVRSIKGLHEVGGGESARHVYNRATYRYNIGVEITGGSLAVLFEELQTSLFSTRA